MIADGLFFHPEGDGPGNVLDRMVDGTTNPRLDDIFAPALDATDRELEKLEEQIERAKLRLRVLVGEKRRAIARKEQQQKAITAYAETGEIDPILEPPVEPLATAEVAEQDAKYKKDIKFTVPDELAEAGWSQKGHVRITDSEEIVVLCRTRKEYSETVDKVEKRLTKAIQFSLQPFRTDGEHFHFMRERIAKRPQQPKGPP